MKDFQFPEKFVWEKETYRPDYGKLTIEPLIRGYGVTIGNALRRVLLSSLWGVAITSIKIEGVSHEFTKFEGIKEDIVEVLMNIKKIRLKPNISEFPHKIAVQVEGPGTVSAEDLVADSALEVLNKDIHIMTLTAKKVFTIDIDITEGRGYVPIEKLKRSKGSSSLPLGSMLIDGLYSPVAKVAYNIENVLYKTSHDYEKLTLELFTTGAVTPKDAVQEATEIINEHFLAIKGKQVIGVKESVEEKITKPAILDDDIHISEFKFSTRVTNGLAKINVHTLHDLLTIPREELEKIKNFGKKSIDEIDTILAERGHKLRTSEEIEQEAKNET